MSLLGKDYFTVAEAADYAGVSVSHWRARVQPEFMPGIFLGREIYRRKDVDRFVLTRIVDGQVLEHSIFRRRQVGRYHDRARRTPVWAPLTLVRGFYEIAKRVSKCTGMSFQVDHIIPLCGKNVSGLHVPGNLRVIPARINARKSRKFEIE